MRVLVLLLVIVCSACADVEQRPTKELPARYSQLGLSSIDQLDNFQFRKDRSADKQSVVVRNSSGDSYLMVFDREIGFRHVSVEIKRGSTLLAGSTVISVCSDGVRKRGGTSFRVDCVGSLVLSKIELIYPLKNMEQENTVIKFLRANH